MGFLFCGKYPSVCSTLGQEAAELRNHEKQAAEELGQWNEKRELPGDELQTEMTITFVHSPQLPASAPRQLPAGPPKTA